MTRITAVIVDDEPLARANVRALLEAEPDVEIVAECASAADAVRVVREAQPDVVFMDIRMPGVSGLDAAHVLDGASAIVFVTAYDAHAVAAFEANALDYVLKPIETRRFSAALERVRRRVVEEADVAFAMRVRAVLGEVAAGRPTQDAAREARLRIHASGRTTFVRVDDIEWIEADGAHVVIHTRDGHHRMRASIGDLERRLDANRFVRIHRSCIVAVERIREIQPYFHGDHIVILENGKRLRMGRRRRDAIRRLTGR